MDNHKEKRTSVEKKIDEKIKIGQVNALVLDRITGVGAYLIAPNSDSKEGILLPQKELTPEMKKGDTIDAFIYQDSKDRAIATLRRPKIQLGEMAVLRVRDVTKIGAFLDWGLEKDLLLPYTEQPTKVQCGKHYLVYLYLDKTGRLCTSAKVYEHLQIDAPYIEGDWVNGYIYQIVNKLGALVAIDNKYHGLIPYKEMTDDIHIGNTVKARVTQIRKDGKLVLAVKKKAYKEIPLDASRILKKLEEADGRLPYNDKTSPAIIKKEFDMSKASFKRALGRLLKIDRIKQTAKGIELKK